MSAPTPTSPATALSGGVCRLPQWGVISARGADAASFLHGQLSNDITHLATDRARLAAYCDAKGRMLASLIVTRRAPDALWLLCSADLLAATLKRLSLFVLRAQCKLSDASAERVVLGLAGAEPAAVAATLAGVALPTQPWTRTDADAAGEAQWLRLPDAAGTPRWLWIGPPTAAEALCQALPALDATAWQWLDVQAGIAPVVAATSGHFVPQMLNYELVGGVDFRKGCYPGQEVVARSQYLGKLKRRAFLAAAAAGTPVPAPGTEVYWSEDDAQPAGEVAAAAPAGDGTAWLLTELKVGAIGTGQLHLGRAGGPVLTLQPLPYAVPLEAPTAPPGELA